jgi:MHS family proline/betaine transporter-like MFS transporter
MDPADLDAWGWRLPFMFGMLIGPVALYIRLRVPETSEFEAAEAAENPLQEAWTEQRPRLYISVAVSALGTISNYVILFTPTFASRDAFFATLATGVVQFLLAPVVGWFGDRVGRMPLMLASATAMLVLIVPLYSVLLAYPTASTLIGIQIIYGILATSYFASQPAFMADLFPVRTRGTGMSLGYNIAVTVFGGIAPLIIATLIQVTGSKLAPSFYVMTGAIISLIGLFAFRALQRREAGAPIIQRNATVQIP